MEPKPITEPTRVNPYAVPNDQQGWRGLGLDDQRAHRKTYTLLWNDQVLVCALLLIPGERSIRHSHESGELSITFSDPLHPYSAALSASFPRIGDPEARFAPAGLPGDPPDPAELPSGCSFHPRCPQRFDDCDRVLPELRGDTTRAAACLLVDAP